MKKDFLELSMGLLMVAIIYSSFHFLNRAKAAGADLEKKTYQVVLDAGHGGDDPGKIGVDGCLEKEINLKLVFRIKDYLEAAGVTVYLTRETDEDLAGPTGGNRKRADLESRCQKIEEWKPDVVISIHQNSYHEESIEGPQVFYYEKSKEGKTLAELIQKGFSQVIGEKNRREAKGNSEYYLLLHTSCPVVIVECGFLSNQRECEKLQEEAYQDQMARAIQENIVQYLKKYIKK